MTKLIINKLFTKYRNEVLLKSNNTTSINDKII